MAHFIKKIAPLYHSIKAHCNAVPLYFEKPKKIFPFSPDNGGCRRELVCPDNAETHFRRLKEPRNAFSLRRCSLFRPLLRLLFFRSDIQFFIIIAHQTQKRKRLQVIYFRKRFATLYSSKARASMVGLKILSSKR